MRDFGALEECDFRLGLCIDLSCFFGAFQAALFDVPRMMCGCSEPFCAQAVEEHIAATVDMFLRAYSPCRGRA